MRIVVAECSAIYTGRGDTKLGKYTRAIIIKDDGAISIHNDKSNKPLNYMGKGSKFTETVHEVTGELVWAFDSRKESLTIILHNVISDSAFELGLEDAGLERDGTENHLQEWIAAHPSVLGEGFQLVQREYPTGSGPVDLLVLDENGKPVAVEVKRVAMLGAVDQASRYVEALTNTESETIDFSEVRGMVAALDIRPNTVKLADKRGIRYCIVPSSWRE